MASVLDLARAAAQAALATEGVHRLGAGLYAEAATYERDEKVSGVVVSADEIEVHIVASYPFPKPIPELSAKIQERVASLAEGRRVLVVVEDIEEAEDASL